MIELNANLSEDEWKGLHSSYVELRSQIITIRHSEFLEGLWFLRLPEQIATDLDSKTGPYQVGMSWTRIQNGWGFAQTPIVGLNGTVEGIISSSGADTIDFTLSVHNQSPDRLESNIGLAVFQPFTCDALLPLSQFRLL